MMELLSVAGSSGGAPMVSSTMSGSPRQLGRYALLRPVRQGGAGDAYLASGPSGDLVTVTLVGRPLVTDDGWARRLRTDVAEARRVAAPGTARLLAADFETATPFVVAEHVEGPTLERHVATAGPLSAAATYELALATATALVGIHAAGLVHRGLSPATVVLGHAGARVTDLGLCPPYPVPAAPTGRARWLAPEQRVGEPVTAATDVYSWGVLVFFAATGGAAPGGDDVATAGLAAGRTEAPEPLAPLLDAVLRRDPRERPAAHELVRQLLAAGRDDAGAKLGVAPAGFLAHGAHDGVRQAALRALEQHDRGAAPRGGVITAPAEQPAELADPFRSAELAKSSQQAEFADLSRQAAPTGPFGSADPPEFGDLTEPVEPPLPGPSRAARGVWAERSSAAPPRSEVPLPVTGYPRWLSRAEPVPTPAVADDTVVEVAVPEGRPWFRRKRVLLPLAMTVVLGATTTAVALAEPDVPWERVAALGGIDGLLPGGDSGESGQGQAAQIGPLSVQVVAAGCGESSLGEGVLAREASGEFCLVTLDVTNTDTEAAAFDPSVQRAVDAAGRRHGTAEQAWWYHDPARAFNSQLSAGETVRGDLVFDVPVGTDLVALVARDGWHGARGSLPLPAEPGGDEQAPPADDGA